MKKESINNSKLGIFLIAGLLVLVFALYMIGKDQNLFTSNFRLRARFRDVAGLMPGNNVRYSGIQNGTVKTIRILDDTTIEVTMYISKDIRKYVRKNAMAVIGTEGLMGNKVINISAGDASVPLVEDNDILPVKKQGDLGEAMGTLYKTNDNVAVISAELLQTIKTINKSPVLQQILYDTSLPKNVHGSLESIKDATTRINAAASLLENTVKDINQGKGTAGLLLADKDARAKMELAINNIQATSNEANNLMKRLNLVSESLQSGLESKDGVVHALLKDTSILGQLSRSLQHIESGTAAFSEDMEALKHNFLTRGYFRRQEKKKNEDK